MISSERVFDIENRIFEKIRQLTVDKENEGTTIRRRFNAIDKFNLGIIDFVQFRKVMHELGFCFSDDELKAVFYKFTGGSEKLVYSELCDYFKDLGVGLPPNLNPAYTLYRKHPDDLIQKLKKELRSRGHFEIGKLRIIFEKSDKDKSGSLTRDEFVWALKEIGLALTKTDYDKLFRHFDRNMDNRVSYKEFLGQFINDLNVSRMQHAEDIYRRLAGAPGNTVTFDRISQCFDPRNDPEVGSYE
jgi:Ca2+-binding EF-hand superfamily protein